MMNVRTLLVNIKQAEVWISSDSLAVRNRSHVFLSLLNSSPGARWSLEARQVTCETMEQEEQEEEEEQEQQEQQDQQEQQEEQEQQEQQEESLSSLLDVCGEVSVLKERPRRSPAPEMFPWRALRELLWTEIKRRTARGSSGRSVSREGRLLFGRFVTSFQTAGHIPPNLLGLKDPEFFRPF